MHAMHIFWPLALPRSSGSGSHECFLRHGTSQNQAAAAGNRNNEGAMQRCTKRPSKNTLWETKLAKSGHIRPWGQGNPLFFWKSPMSSLGFSEKTAAAVRSCQGLGHSPWSMRAPDFPCRGEPKVLPFLRGLGTKKLWETMENDAHVHVHLCRCMCTSSCKSSHSQPMHYRRTNSWIKKSIDSVFYETTFQGLDTFPTFSNFSEFARLGPIAWAFRNTPRICE